jgi:hypothetical protein
MKADLKRRMLRPALGLAIVLAHLGLATLLSLRPAPAPMTEARLQVRLIPIERPTEASQAAAPPQRATPPRTTSTPPAIVLLPAPPVEADPAPPTQASPPVAEAPASAPPPLLLHTEATRRAVREASRNPPLAVVAQNGLPQRETRDQRLARTMGEAGRGDCGKGEYAGGGMGLLSLPFWIAAEVRGQCAK